MVRDIQCIENLPALQQKYFNSFLFDFVVLCKVNAFICRLRCMQVCVCLHSSYLDDSVLLIKFGARVGVVLINDKMNISLFFVVFLSIVSLFCTLHLYTSSLLPFSLSTFYCFKALSMTSPEWIYVTYTNNRMVRLARSPTKIYQMAHVNFEQRKKKIMKYENLKITHSCF